MGHRLQTASRGANNQTASHRGLHRPGWAGHTVRPLGAGVCGRVNGDRGDPAQRRPGGGQGRPAGRRSGGPQGG